MFYKKMWISVNNRCIIINYFKMAQETHRLFISTCRNGGILCQLKKYTCRTAGVFSLNI